MTEKRAFRNVLTNVIVQILLAISGLLIPRYILQLYGSATNGMISSIGQFVTYAALIEMGIGNASIVALYHPIAQGDRAQINSILTESRKLYIRSGWIYTVILAFIAIMYPLLLVGQMDYMFVCSMVFCIGIVNAIDYFILGKYKVFLIADQKYYILNIARALATIVLIVGSTFLLYCNVSMVLVKGVAVATHLGESLFVYLYIRTKYPYLNYHSKKAYKIRQRWNALIHQLCATIVYNTDLVVLTIFLPGRSLQEISVYTAYALPFSLLTNMVSTLTTGMNASFGNLLARDERDKVLRFFSVYEFVYFITTFIACTCFAGLIIPFVSCYTKGVGDVNYIRYGVGILFAINGLIAQVKDVSGLVVKAAGRYKETQRYAVEEAVVNIIISLLLIGRWGIMGVLLGTFISHLVMTFQLMRYVVKELLPSTGEKTVKRVLRNMIVFFLLSAMELRYVKPTTDWMIWLIQTALILGVNVIVFCGVNCISEIGLTKEIKNQIVERFRVKQQ